MNKVFVVNREYWNGEFEVSEVHKVFKNEKSAKKFCDTENEKRKTGYSSYYSYIEMDAE